MPFLLLSHVVCEDGIKQGASTFLRTSERLLNDCKISKSLHRHLPCDLGQITLMSEPQIPHLCIVFTIPTILCSQQNYNGVMTWKVLGTVPGTKVGINKHSCGPGNMVGPKCQTPLLDRVPTPNCLFPSGSLCLVCSSTLRKGQQQREALCMLGLMSQPVSGTSSISAWCLQMPLMTDPVLKLLLGNERVGAGEWNPTS